MYYQHSKKTRKVYAMRHHCINKKSLRMAFYNGNKQERGTVSVPHLHTRWQADSARLPVKTDYGHCGHYDTQYEIRIFQTEYKYQIYPLSSAVGMFHVQINISNRTPQSGVLRDVTVALLVKKFPVNYSTRRSIPSCTAARSPSPHSARHTSTLTSHLCPRHHIGLCHLGCWNKIL